MDAVILEHLQLFLPCFQSIANNIKSPKRNHSLMMFPQVEVKDFRPFLDFIVVFIPRPFKCKQQALRIFYSNKATGTFELIFLYFNTNVNGCY